MVSTTQGFLLGLLGGAADSINEQNRAEAQAASEAAKFDNQVKLLETRLDTEGRVTAAREADKSEKERLKNIAVSTSAKDVRDNGVDIFDAYSKVSETHNVSFKDFNSAVKDTSGSFKVLTSDERKQLGFPDNVSVQKNTDTGEISILKFPGEEASAKEQQISSLIDRGIAQSDAEDVVNGNVKIVNDRTTGGISLVNRVTGEVKDLGDARDRELQRAADVVERGVTVSGQTDENKGFRPDISTTIIPASRKAKEEADKVLRRVQGIFKLMKTLPPNVTRGVGAFSNIKSAVDSLFGVLGLGTAFKDNEANRQLLRQFNQSAKRGLTGAGKLFKDDLIDVKGILPNPDSFTQNPETQQANLGRLALALQLTFENKVAILTGRPVPSKAIPEMDLITIKGIDPHLLTGPEIRQVRERIMELREAGK